MMTSKHVTTWTSSLKMEETSSSQENFEALGVDPRILKGIRKLGLERPTPVQARCVPLALQGKDVLARAPTGSGKTYAYAIPVLQRVLERQDAASTSETGTTGVVILLPTRELCQQVYGVVRSLARHSGTGHVCIVQLSSPADDAVLRAADVPDVIIATPSRLLNHLPRGVGGGGGGGGVNLSGLHTLVVDEADLLLSYGYGDDIASIGNALPPAVQTLLVSATVTPDLDAVTKLLLHNPVTVDVGEETGAAADGSGLRQFWLRCSHADKFLVM